MNKTIQRKLLTSLILIIFMTNIFVSNITVVYADDGEMTAVEKLENGIVIATDVLEDSLNVVMGSVVGLLTKPFRALALALADGLDDIVADLAYSQGTVNSDGSIRPDTIWRDAGESLGGLAETLTLGILTFKPSVTPFDILFNKLALVDINFFNIPAEVLGQTSIIRNIRLSIASWYYIMRNIAAVILLCVLIYVGIRMAISTVASDKAAYKKMLVDWVCSLALIFLIQYIIIFTISVNEALVNSLKEMSGDDGVTLTRSIISIKQTAKNWFTLDSIAATIVYCMLIGQTLSLLLTYFNRMLKVAFLIIISPLITLTYSIDKMGDGKAQALGTWLKEFVYTVLIQSFHCIIYMVFIKMAVSILDSGLAESYNLAGSFLAVMCIKFTKDAEKILGKIFKFGDSTSDTSLAVGMALSAAAFSKAGNIGKGTVKAVNGVKNFAHNATAFAHTWRVSRAAVKERQDARDRGEEISMDQAKAIAEEKVTRQEADRAEKKNKKKYNVSSDDAAYQDAVSKKQKELMAGGMSEKLAKEKARAHVAAETRRQKKEENFNSKHKTIARVRGSIKPYQEVWSDFRSTDAYKQLAGVAQGYVATGAGLFFGATAYGMNGDAVKALAIGGTGFKGTQEIFKNSSTTMVDTAKSITHALGANSETEAVAEMELTQSMSATLSNNDELNRTIEQMWSEVDALIRGLKIDSSKASSIQGTIKDTIAREIKNDPSITNDELMQKIQGQLIGKHSDVLSDDKRKELLDSSAFGTALADNADIRRRKELYDTMQNASELGLDPGTFASMVGKRYRGSEEIPPEKSSKVRRFEKKLEKSRDSMNYDTMSDVEINQKSREQHELAEKIQDTCAEELEDLKNIYENKYKHLIEQLVPDLQEDARQEIIQQLKEARFEYEKDLNRFKEAYQGESYCQSSTRGGTDEKFAYMQKADLEGAQKLLDSMDIPDK